MGSWVNVEIHQMFREHVLGGQFCARRMESDIWSFSWQGTFMGGAQKVSLGKTRLGNFSNMSTSDFLLPHLKSQHKFTSPKKCHF